LLASSIASGFRDRSRLDLKAVLNSSPRDAGNPTMIPVLASLSRSLCGVHGPHARLLFVLLLVSFVGCNTEEKKEEEEEGHPAPVKVAEPEHAAYGEYVELLGATQPLLDRVARVTAAVEGHVHSVLHDEKGPLAEGQEVKKGQVLVELDDRVAKANRDKLQATLDEFTEQRQQAEVAIKLAQLDVERLEKLKPSVANETVPLVSRIELEKAKLALEDAQIKARSVVARERAAKADLESHSLLLEYYKLRAPISGRLGMVQAEPGQTLMIGAQVAEILDLTEIDVTCAVPRHVARRLALGQPAWIISGPGETKREGPVGKLAFIALQAQPETGTFLVKVRFPNKEQTLRAGTITRVQVEVQAEKQRLVIPERAVMEDHDPPLIVVVEKEKDRKDPKKMIEVAHLYEAILGVADREHHVVELLGLQDPATKKAVPLEELHVIVEGGHGLENGDPIKIEEPEKEEKDEKHDDKKEKDEKHDDKKEK
jgi:RND family efflux transporter MFP subunit